MRSVDPEDILFPRRGCALSVGQIDMSPDGRGRDAGWRIAHPPLGDHESTGPGLTGTRDERASASPDFRPQINVLLSRLACTLQKSTNGTPNPVCKETRPRPCTKKGVRSGPALATAAWWQLSCGHRCIDLGKLRGFATRQPRIHPTSWLLVEGVGRLSVGVWCLKRKAGRWF